MSNRSTINRIVRSFRVWQDNRWEDKYRKTGIFLSKNEVLGHSKLEQVALPNGRFSNGYESSWVRNVRKSIKVSLILNSNIATFIDVGSGLGKACLAASENQAMKRIIGIEFDEKLNALALNQISNYASTRTIDRIELLAQDASKYVLPNCPSCIYFFNPFSSEILFSFLLLNIESIKANCSVLAYMNDTCREVLEDFGLEVKYQEPNFQFSIWQ